MVNNKEKEKEKEKENEELKQKIINLKDQLNQIKELLLVVCNIVMKESDEKEQVIMKLKQIETKITEEDTKIQETEKEGIL